MPSDARDVAVPEIERDQGMDMLEAADGCFLELAAFSRLGVALFAMTAETLGVEQERPAFGVAAGAALMG